MDQSLSTEYIARTKSEASELLSGLRKVSSLSFTTNNSIQDALSDAFPFDTAHRIAVICKNKGVDTTNTEALQAFLKELTNQVENLPVVTITIAFTPKEKTVNAIYNWFLYQLKKQVLLDIRTDRNLIGSAVIAYKGKYKDYSLSKKLQQQNVSN